MLVKKILMIMTALFLFCGCAAKSVKTSATSVEQTKTEEKQNSFVSENTDQKHTEQVSKSKKQASNSPSGKESAKAEKEKAVSKIEKKSKSKKNTVSSEKKVSSSPVISEDASDSHIHDWVHHEATGHYDTKLVTDQVAYDEAVIDEPTKPAYDEQVVTGTLIVCNDCGREFSSNEDFKNHLGDIEDPSSCSGSSHNKDIYGAKHHDAVPAKTHTVHHEAVTHTEQVWVQDADAYDECSICGVKK